MKISVDDVELFTLTALQQLFLDEKFMNMCAGLFQCNEQKR